MFEEFPKMARLNRECVISEKIDGTNAQVFIEHDDLLPPGDASDDEFFIGRKDGLSLFAGSRTRWISPKNDNHGFAKWVQANADALFGLGPGRHFGEWWGSGIQRGYGLKGGEKRFSLFNADRWTDDAVRPACCGVVPVLYRGLFSTKAVEDALYKLAFDGSQAVKPAYFNDPEGIVIYHTAARIGFKVTLKNDESPKSKAPKAA
jgi:hypothetical protein